MLNKALLGRFAASTPITLFRIQSGLAVKLRPKEEGKHSHDIVRREDGLVLPRDAAELHYLGPNGMSMRPKGNMLSVIVGTFTARNTVVFEVPQGTPLPPELVLLHEHTDHYALQPAQRMKLSAANAALTRFLAQPLVRRYSGVEEFYAAHPNTHPSVVGFSENA